MIFIAGGTGFIGRNLLKALRDRGLKVRALVRSEKKAEEIRPFVEEVVYGDITDRGSLDGLLRGCTLVIHLVGIIKETKRLTFRAVHVEGTENLVEEAKIQGVRDFFYQSALGASPGSPFMYSKTKAEAEEVVKASGLRYLIFRPSLVLGRGDGFSENIKKLLKLGPFVPLPGGGRARFQPIYVEDWVKCFISILDRDDAWGRLYEFGGPEHLTYRQILEQYMEVMGIKKRFVEIPIYAAKWMLPLSFLPRAVGIPVPEVSPEQLEMLSVDNITELDSVERHFGFTPARLKEYITELVS